MRTVCFRFVLAFYVLSLALIFGGGCSTAESKTTSDRPGSTIPGEVMTTSAARGATIEIKPNSPADTVRAFYTALREKRFREAIFLTNLRPAVEGLTDAELKEYQLDFEAIAKYVPAEIQINGEIITGAKATVTAKLPAEDMDTEEIQEIKLRKEGEVWIILTVDESAEQRIRKEGKNYFPALKIDTHQDEARDMLDRVAKAQIAYATMNKGMFGDIEALIGAGFLPPDIKSSASTGYRYSINLSDDRTRYSATAVPEVYGKTGRLVFSVDLDEKGRPHLTSRDAGQSKSK